MKQNCYRPGPSAPTQYYVGERPPMPAAATAPTYSDYPEFKPDCTPEQMFTYGIFGGSYFRDIHSEVTGSNYTSDEAAAEFPWLAQLPRNWWGAPRCQNGVNYHGKFAGTSKEVWEKSGWITAHDPYGWVQWYCRFHAGRRCDDDRRQIDRWTGFVKRMRGLYNSNPTPRVAQALLQWGVLV